MANISLSELDSQGTKKFYLLSYLLTATTHYWHWIQIGKLHIPNPTKGLIYLLQVLKNLK